MDSKNYPWFRTPEQQREFAAYHGEFRIAYNKKDVFPGVLREKTSFQAIVENYPQIFRPGSAVFYYVAGYGNWQHAALMVSAMEPSTNYFSSLSSSAQPMIVEQDGLFDFYDMERQPRSFDDTSNLSITQISIVPAVPTLTVFSIDTSSLIPTEIDEKECFFLQRGGRESYSLVYCPPTASQEVNR
ncbi:MAG: hypothetical protein Kow002_13880 [Anaerolineales bacterium]